MCLYASHLAPPNLCCSQVRSDGGLLASLAAFRCESWQYALDISWPMETLCGALCTHRQRGPLNLRSDLRRSNDEPSDSRQRRDAGGRLSFCRWMNCSALMCNHKGALIPALLQPLVDASCSKQSRSAGYDSLSCSTHSELVGTLSSTARIDLISCRGSDSLRSARTLLCLPGNDNAFRCWDNADAGETIGGAVLA